MKTYQEILHLEFEPNWRRFLEDYSAAIERLGVAFSREIQKCEDEALHESS